MKGYLVDMMCSTEGRAYPCRGGDASDVRNICSEHLRHTAYAARQLYALISISQALVLGALAAGVMVALPGALQEPPVPGSTARQLSKVGP
jgi:hypothetical protein